MVLTLFTVRSHDLWRGHSELIQQTELDINLSKLYIESISVSEHKGEQVKPNLTIEEAAVLHGIASAAVEMERFEDFRPQLRQAQARLEGAIGRAGGRKIEDGWSLPKNRIRYRFAGVELRQEEAIPLVRMADLIISSGREYGMRKVLAAATLKLASALERAGMKILA